MFSPSMEMRTLIRLILYVQDTQDHGGQRNAFLFRSHCLVLDERCCPNTAHQRLDVIGI